MTLNENQPAGGEEKKETSDGETLRLDPAEAEIQGLVLPVAGSEQQPSSEAGGIELEPASAAVSQPAPAAEPVIEQASSSAGGVELEPAADPFALQSEQPEAGFAPEQVPAVVPDGNASGDDKTLVIAPPADVAEQVPPVAGGIELSLSSDTREQTLPGVGGIELEPVSAVSQAEPVAEPSAPQADGGLVIEQAGAIFTKENTSDDDKTVVIAPPASGGDEHTVIYEPGPGGSRGMPEGDLSVLSIKQPPDGVPEERVRTMAFLYAQGEEGFCAGVLSELDSICLRSSSKPMFTRRAFVKTFELDANSNFVLQSVTDAKAAGLICTGNLPQEKLYELENVFSQSGIMFRHLTTENFNHSSALDLVIDLIMR